MKFKIALMILIVLFSFNTVSGYDFFSVLQDDGTAEFNATPPSFFWNGTCTAQIELFATASHASAFSFTNEYFMPTNNRILTGTPTYPSNIVCRAQGNASGSISLNDFYTPRTSTTSSATSTATWARAYYTCVPDTDNLIIYSETNRPDEEGHYPYGYVRATGGWCVNPAGAFPAVATQLSTLTSYLGNGYFTECGNDLFQMEVDQQQVSCAGNKAFGQSFWGVVPFNSGSAGLVNISVTDQDFFSSGANWVGLTCTTNKIYLWDTVTNGTTQIGNAVPFFKDNVLIPDRDYFLFMGSECTAVSGAGASLLGFNSSIYNIRIFAPPTAFVCSDFSECVGGTRFRNCTDTLGNAPDRIEFDTCFDNPEFSNLLGFEQISGETSSGDVYICNKGWDVFNCPDVLNTISAQFPQNWTVSSSIDVFSGAYRQNYIRITQDTSTEGSKSLQMWYIPPKPEEPLNNGTGGTVCGNNTEGDSPETSTGFNETTFISANVSFPAPFVQLRLDVRKCSEPVVQRDNSNNTWAPFCDGFFPGSFNRKRCYGRDCETEPKGRYGISLFQNLTTPRLLDYSSAATNQWQTKIIDLSNVGIQPGINYTVSLSVNPENQYDPDTHCVYFDNVLATLTEGALPECITQCDPVTLTLNLATLVGKACVFTQEPLSPQCGATVDQSQNLQDLADGTINFTCIGTTQVFFDENGLEDRIEDSELCVGVETGINITSTLPLTNVGDSIEFIFTFLLTPIFLFFIIATIISGILTAKTKHWEIGGVAFAFMLLMGSIIRLPNSTSPIVPEFITIVIIAVVALLIGAKLSGFAVKGGG